MSSTMYRAENEMQGLLRLHSYSAAAQKANKDIPWQTIKTTILRSRPIWAESFEDMMAFVASRSGGMEGRFLLYLAAFNRNHVDSTRTSLSPALYRALADFPSHYVALALFQAAWRCPKESDERALLGHLGLGGERFIQVAGRIVPPAAGLLKGFVPSGRKAGSCCEPPKTRLLSTLGLAVAAARGKGAAVVSL